MINKNLHYQKYLIKGLFFCLAVFYFTSLYYCYDLVGIGKEKFSLIHLPNLLLVIIIFPTVIGLFWKYKEFIRWFDYSVVILPPVLWLLHVAGGSGANFYYLNPAIIMLCSTIYFMRFNKNIEKLRISPFLLSGLIWFFIILLIAAIGWFIIGPLPE